MIGSKSIRLALKEIRAYLVSFFRSTYEPGETKSQRIDFSSQRIVSYVPGIRLDTLLYPWLACNVDGIDKASIGWHDTKHTYDKHNLIFDVPFEGLHRSKRTSLASKARLRDSLHRSTGSLPETPDQETEPIFSVVKHYPPEWERKLRLEREMVGPACSHSFDDIGDSWAPLC